MRNPFEEQANYHKKEAIKWSNRSKIAGVILVIVVYLCFTIC